MKSLKTLLVAVLIALGAFIPFTSSSRDQAYLLSVQEQGRPYALYLAVQGGSEEALRQLSDYASQSNDPYWLQQAALLGDAEAYYSLAMQEDNESKQQRIMSRAAEAGHAKAQYELALLSDDLNRRIKWLQQSAEQDYLPAVIALYQWYLADLQPEAAQPWLEKAAQSDGPSALLLARTLWRQGEYEQAKQYFERADELKVPQAGDYLKLISQNWRNQAVNKVNIAAVNNTQQCAIKIQPLALSLENLIQYKQLASNFKQDKRLQDLPICLGTPLWLKPDTLACSDNWQGSRRLGCDASKLDSLPLDADFTHVLVLAELGKANVNNGIMYLDLGDTYSVFVHELAHFSGFVDEYPLSSEMAEQVCQPHHPAPNLVFVEGDEVMTAASEKWGEAQQGWKLARARTCNNHAMQAYKASDSLTFMEYHDQEYIPELYLALWKASLEQQETLLPAYINIAQALEERGRLDAAQRWWQRHARYQYNIYGPYPQVVGSAAPTTTTELVSQ
ncbi:hypothetical protein P2G88_18355 [Aliiglaciecola sp. CAU 1673]|uniref:tetratricopeptide repeat protein n=1 Tax=Aliiglaciecola sp. CAU 1673 TaxID=3032595 RepID=UPI0023DAED94|nr:hypothetical protein [Aliiglaciecola sp. CAU 1673]MDF2180222.1 hypothetical protein [Aliiglaciecola sp. CAU 1673]